MQQHDHEFAEWEVTADGSVTLAFADPLGNKTRIRLTVNQIGALAMTLPELMTRALRTVHRDEQLRYAYPLTSWTVEQSTDPRTGMMILGTADGFRVCFSMGRDIQTELGRALVTETPSDRPSVAN